MNEVRKLLKFFFSLFLCIYLGILGISTIIISHRLYVIISHLYSIYLHCYFLYIDYCFDTWSVGNVSYIRGIRDSACYIYGPVLDKYIQNSAFISLHIVYIVTVSSFIMIFLLYMCYGELKRFLFIFGILLSFISIPACVFILYYKYSYGMLECLFNIIINASNINMDYINDYSPGVLYVNYFFPLFVFLVKKYVSVFYNGEKPKFLTKISEDSRIRIFHVLTMVRDVFYLIFFFKCFVIIVRLIFLIYFFLKCYTKFCYLLLLVM